LNAFTKTHVYTDIAFYVWESKTPNKQYCIN